MYPKGGVKVALFTPFFGTVAMNHVTSMSLELVYV